MPGHQIELEKSRFTRTETSGHSFSEKELAGREQPLL